MTPLFEGALIGGILGNILDKRLPGLEMENVSGW
jgi:hypothetical protein